MEQKKQIRKKRVGWGYYTIYCPREGVEALRSFYKQWKRNNIQRWFLDEVEQVKEQ